MSPGLIGRPTVMMQFFIQQGGWRLWARRPLASLDTSASSMTSLGLSGASKPATYGRPVVTQNVIIGEPATEPPPPKSHVPFSSEKSRAIATEGVRNGDESPKPACTSVCEDLFAEAYHGAIIFFSEHSTDKTSMLDDIIDHVKFLQLQVKI
ncbi:Transcription factor UNE12 [Platanthera guangdongensis]|uniref:Transcription factor UNE12 n=1 Tax=Platanthera guangdongensis TaxID=2320717 RepID=A0ABR2N567_9ASPA